MSKKNKTPYNHEAQDIEQACGLVEGRTQEKYGEIVSRLNKNKGEKSLSELVEALEKGLSKREIAYIAAVKIMEDNREPSPIDKLMAMMASQKE